MGNYDQKSNKNQGLERGTNPDCALLIGSLIVISSFSIVAKRIGTDDCNLSKRCCKIISKYDALESCEKILCKKTFFFF